MLFRSVILVRYAGFAAVEMPFIREYQAFSDEKAIADYALEAVIQCFRSGVVNGKPGNLFDPEGAATRVETAAMLHRFLERSGEIAE